VKIFKLGEVTDCSKSLTAHRRDMRLIYSAKIFERSKTVATLKFNIFAILKIFNLRMVVLCRYE